MSFRRDHILQLETRILTYFDAEGSNPFEFDKAEGEQL